MALPGKPSGISQTSFIFASVFIAYLVFITLKGDLGRWLGVFGFGAAASAAPAGNVAVGLPQITPLTPLAGMGSASGGATSSMTSSQGMLY